MPVFAIFFRFLVFVIVKSAGADNRLVKPWTASARALGGKCSSDGPRELPKIYGERGEHTFRVRSIRRRHNRHWRTGTLYTITSPALPFAFVLRRLEDLNGELKSDKEPEEMGSMLSVDLGDPYFATRFLLLSDDPAAARAYFDIHRRREVDHHLGEMDGLLLTNRTLQHMRWMSENRSERLTATVESMLEIAESLRLPSRSDFTSAPPAVGEPAPAPSAALAGLEPEPIVQEYAPQMDSPLGPLMPELFEQLQPTEPEPMPEPEPEPAPTPPPPSVTLTEIFDSLFLDGRMGMDVEQDFAAHYAGGHLTGEGKVMRIDEAPRAARGQETRGRIAHVEVLAAHAQPHQRPIAVLLPIPPEWPALQPGADPPTVRFSGMLESCEPYLRRVTLQVSGTRLDS